jgi:hypothetical protein
MDHGRRLYIPSYVPEDFARAVATVLLLGVAEGDLWDLIYRYPPDKAIEWIEAILKANETDGLVHSDIQWWEHQVYGH